MSFIFNIIQKIKLLKGTRADTGSTGQGCFMNVIAYLNGEDQITDISECVCEIARPIAIVTNDLATDKEREQLIPYIERAMGSVTNDLNEKIRRAWLAVDLANICKDIAVKNEVKNASEHAKLAAKVADRNAKLAAEYAAMYAGNADAEYAAGYAGKHAANAVYIVGNAETRSLLFSEGLKFLDAALPKTPIIDTKVIDRAVNLTALCETTKIGQSA